MRIELAELGLPALDALDVDALAVFVGPERPLQGLAGYTDWRLCGMLSRAIRAGDWAPEGGEALLLTSGGRLAVPRIFCFPVSDAPLTGHRLESACHKGCERIARAGSEAFATALPPHRLEDGPAAARAWLETAVRFPVKRQVVLGDSRVLHRDFTVAREALGVDVEIAIPVQRVELPGRAAGLPHPGAVLR